jgi:nicotinate phosphoribosyltransferase
VSTLPFGFSELLLAGRMRQSGCEETWTFEISLPVLPPKRSFLIAAGLEHAVGMLERFAEEGVDLTGLDPKRLPAPLDAALLEQIESLRFTGSVEAVPEGTVVFAGEPVLRLRAPAPEAVLVGAALVGSLRSQTAVATKAARLVLAAGGKPVYEIGVRSGVRETALHAARSAHLGGASASSNAGAALEFGLPSLPVVPLTLVAALGGMVAGLEACGVLIDGALANEGDAALTALSVTPRAIIIDAGTRNLAARVTAMRSGIQSLGWRTTRILVGGRVDEEIIDALQKAGVDVDGFCVGGELIVAADSPCVAFDYELVEREVDGHKIPLPRRDGGVGRRSVWRRREAGKFKSDTVQAETKPPPPGGMPLLVRVVEKGRRLFRAPSLAEVRVLCGSQLSMIDPNVTRRVDPDTYTVTCVVDKKPEEAAPASKAKKAVPPPEAPPKPGPLGAADARRRALSQIDDSADFSAISGAFDSVVSPHLGGDEAAGSSEDEAPADDTALPAEDAAPAEDAPEAEDAPQETEGEPMATEEGAEPAAEPEDSFEAIHLDDPPAAEPDGEESIAGTTEETAVEATEPDANSETAPDGDEVPAEALATEEAPAVADAAAPVEDFASMVVQLAPERGDFEPAAVAGPDGADEAPADGIIEIVPPAAPPRAAPAKRAASTAKAAPRTAPPPEPAEDLEVLPTFGNPTPPRRSVAFEGGASTSNPLLAAAARLRSMQRGEPLQPQSPVAPIESVSAPKPAPAAKKAPATDSPADPLLAAAARLKSMRGS